MASVEYTEKDESFAGSLEDQRAVVRSRSCTIVQFALGIMPPFHITVPFRKISKIDCIVDVNIRSTDPPCSIWGICQKKITRHPIHGYPLVGFTVVGCTGLSVGNTASGTTLCAEVVIIGF